MVVGRCVVQVKAITLQRVGPAVAGQSAAWIDRGYKALLLLALALPFELTQRPLIHTRYLTVTNLKLILYIVIVLAGLTLMPSVQALLESLFIKSLDRSNYLFQRRVPVLIFSALLLATIISSLLSTHRIEGLKWTLDIAVGGLLWLAIPLWLSGDTEQKIDGLGIAIVIGAVVSAFVGFWEVSSSQHFIAQLSWFKSGPSVVGPYIRLSATFEYANIAALYFELALVLSLVGFIKAVLKHVGLLFTSAWLAASAVLLAAVLLTYSRGALIGLAFGLVALTLTARKRVNLRSLQGRGRILLTLPITLIVVASAVLLSSRSVTLLRLSSQSDQSWYRATYGAVLPSQLKAGKQITVPVRVTNLTPFTWNAQGLHFFTLGYHWLYPSGSVASFDGNHSRLASNLAPNHVETVSAVIRLPNRAGRYGLVWDMAEEGVAWFSLKSSEYQVSTENILPSASEKTTTSTASTFGPSRLPTTVAKPTRQHLWAAAIGMISAHPLFGVGPDGFRLNYGSYTRPRQTSWDTRIFANSLPLEIFADLGIVGGLLFWAFILSLSWTLLRGLLKGNVDQLWQLALVACLAAFIGHGFVDYVLGSNAIFITFLIMCGLAATALRPLGENVVALPLEAEK